MVGALSQRITRVMKLDGYVSRARAVLGQLAGSDIAPIDPELMGRRSDSALSTGALELVTEISKYVPSGASVLEVGCGNGHISKVIIDKGNRLLAVDISAEAIEECRRKFGNAARFEVVDLPSYRTDERFEYAFINETLEQVKDDDGMLRAIFALLAPGGRLVLSNVVDQARVPEFTVHTYTLADLRGKLENAGFSLDTADTYGGALSQVAALASRKIRFPKPFLRAVRNFPLYRALMAMDAKLKLAGGRAILVGVKPRS